MPQPDPRSAALHGFALPASICTLFQGGKAIDQEERKALLARVRAGEALEVEFDAVTFAQGNEPNRNFLRFKPGILRTLARSFEGVPFLRDHRQHDVLARGGTIVESKAVRENESDDEESARWVFHQRIRAVKPWAVEGVLDGTIDRFSIGWSPVGPVVYRHNGEKLERWPRHWPGDVLEDGTVVEWMFTGAEGVETSGVNVPAVVDTGIEGVRAALSAVLGLNRVEEGNSMKRIATKLGLGEASSEDDVLGAIAKLEQNHAEVELKLAASEEAKAHLTARLADVEAGKRAAEETILKAHVDRRVAELKSVGALPIVRGPDGEPTESSNERLLRSAAARGGIQEFEAVAADYKAGAFSVVGAELQLRQTPGRKDGDVRALLSTPEMQSAMKANRLTEEDVIKYGGLDRRANGGN